MSSLSSFLDPKRADAALTDVPLLRPVAFTQPLRIEYGLGKARQLETLLGGWSDRRVLVVADAYNAGRVDILGLPLGAQVFGTVKPEPNLPNLDEALALARDIRPEIIIGYGGGSAIDLAKLVAVLMDSRRSFHDIVGPGKADARTVRLVAIPTTAGTGSEVGARALLTDPQGNSKLAVESVHMIPDLAVVDPELTVSLPRALTAATGIDALAHCVEAYTSRRAHPLIDIYAEQGIALIGQYLARAVADGSDLEARAGLAMAALYGGFCLGPVNTTAGHALSYPLGTRYSVPHGLANAVIFPHTLAFNASAQPGKTATIARLLGLDTSDLFGSAYRFCERLGLSMKISELGVSATDVDSMAEEAYGIRRLLDYNPRPLGQDQIAAIYRAAL